MPSTGRMRYLTTVQGSFHGRLVAARLGAEGVLVELRGVSDGPYPLQGAVEVFVSEGQLEIAREILLADAVDAAVDADRIELDYGSHPSSQRDPVAREALAEEFTDSELPGPRPHRQGDRLEAAVALALVAALIIVGIVVVAVH
jgi:hypothetical protein